MQVLREQRTPVEAAEIRIREYLRQLDGTVRAEVEEYDGIAALYCSCRFAFAVHNNTRLNKFIIHRVLVGCSNRL
ncbi:hypothetical protein D3C87_1977060 [compost metagenome]